MHKLFEFIRSVYVAVLFIVLEVIAISYYARSTYYTQARLLTRSNQVIGGVHSLFTGVHRYFSLGHENRQLSERVIQLEERLAQYVIPEMGVLSPDGAMAGYVVDCTDRYSVAMSALNTSFRASGKLAGSEYYGSIYWDGRDQNVVILSDVSKYADPQPGEEVVTTGFSQYFPADVLIGWVESAEMNETRTAYTVRVRLAAEISRLNEVILVANRDLYEIRDLQQSDLIEQHTRLE